MDAAGQIRFSVADGEGHRAATWKCWNHRGTDEVYLVCRELGGAIKTSLHQSGQWHHSYAPDFFASSVDHADSRFIETWPRPQPIAPGFTVAHRIVVPWGALTSPVDPTSEHRITWIPGANEGFAREIDVIITAPNREVNGWPGKQKQSTELVGSFETQNGERVWIVHWQIQSPDFSKLPKTVAPQYFRGKSRADFIPGSMFRMFVFGQEPDGSRTIYDCALQVGKWWRLRQFLNFRRLISVVSHRIQKIWQYCRGG